ncbi:hypothetical protein [Caldovatus aquaticus]|uniref:Uncharacterized protein n=1 Tax=Caldovatus aquaticus TaxID=2865671 RepID=A0ABS7EYK2_9PROT|nr:hypothetical protein [Caldovatus aquaticus]MBW8268440.1 hypothetical protein [Caldovatus aquaticus]
MPLAEPGADPAALPAFAALAGRRRWDARLSELGRRARSSPGSLWRGRAAQRRHALELALARLGDPDAFARAGRGERRLLAFAAEAVHLANALPPRGRARLRERLAAGLEGEATLVPVFHLLRSAAVYRARGFAVEFPGLAEGAPFDLLIRRGEAEAVVACETFSAEEGRSLHRGDWYALVDRVHPELQTWLAAHPGRYVLKMTLPEGLAGPGRLAELHRRISRLLAAQRRQDSSADAVLKLDPLVLAGAQAAGQGRLLPERLREQFGPEAHLAVTTDRAGGSVFVMAARAGREDAIAEAFRHRLAQAAETRLGEAGRGLPGILAVLVEDVDRAEWRALRESLELEGAARRFLTTAAARTVAAVTCCSRMELLGLPPPDAVPEGELRFRNPAHPAARHPVLAEAIQPPA